MLHLCFAVAEQVLKMANPTPSKYTVSFNSDTESSSEEEEESTETETETEEEEEDEETESEEESGEEVASPPSPSKPAATDVKPTPEPPAKKSPSPAAADDDGDDNDTSAEFTLSFTGSFSFDTTESPIVNGASPGDTTVTSSGDTTVTSPGDATVTSQSNVKDATPEVECTFSMDASITETTSQAKEEEEEKSFTSNNLGNTTENMDVKSSVHTGDTISSVSSDACDKLEVTTSASAKVSDNREEVSSQVPATSPQSEAELPVHSPGGSTDDVLSPGPRPSSETEAGRTVRQESGSDQCQQPQQQPQQNEAAAAVEGSEADAISGHTGHKAASLEQSDSSCTPADGQALMDLSAQTTMIDTAAEVTQEGQQSVQQTSKDPVVEAIGGETTENQDKMGDLSLDLEGAENTANLPPPKVEASKDSGDADLICLDETKSKDIILDPLKDETKVDTRVDVEEEKSTSPRATINGDKPLAVSLTKNKTLVDSPLQSPKAKVVADDDFAARISRAKAFIESTNGVLGQSEDKPDDNSIAPDIDEGSNIANSNEEKFVLGTVVVTTAEAAPADTDLGYTRSKKPRDTLEEDQATADMDDSTRVRDRYVSDSTSELIKRILAEARGEAYEEPPRRPHEEGDPDSFDDQTGASYRKSHTAKDESTSLLERRIESMKKRNQELSSDDFSPRSSRSKKFNYPEPESVSTREMVLYDEDDARSTASGYSRASTQRSRYREAWRDRHQPCVDDDNDSVFYDPMAGALVPYEEPDEDDILYKTRRALMRQQVLPDEAFRPQKSEDTDEIVKEKTTDIRNVVSRQENVLEDLRKASQSFEEIEDEIKEIRQQFYESQEKRALIHDEIEYDLELAKRHEEELAAQAYARKYAPPQAIDYTKGFIPSQTAPKAITWERETDNDDTMSISSHKGLAIKSSGWTGPGTRLAGSASLDYNKSDNWETESVSSLSSYRAKQRPASASGKSYGRSLYNPTRARSLMQEYDGQSEDASSLVSREEDLDGMEGLDADMGANKGPASWKASHRMNGDDGRDYAAEPRRNRPGGITENFEQEISDLSDDLSAKINSWRSKMETDHNEANGEAGRPIRRSYLDADDVGNSTSSKPSMVNGFDDDKGLANSWRSKMNNTDDNAGMRHTGMNGMGDNLDDNEDSEDYPWRSKVNKVRNAYSLQNRDNVGDVGSNTGAHSWRSRLNGNDETAGTQHTPYSWRRTASTQDPAVGHEDSGVPSYSSRFDRYGKTYSIDDTDNSSAYSAYSRSSRLGRSTTLSDYEYRPPDRRARARSCEPGSGTGFQSKFLSKVREQKSTGGAAQSKSRDKPFKSRFLKASFSTDSGSQQTDSGIKAEAGNE